MPKKKIVVIIVAIVLACIIFVLLRRKKNNSKAVDLALDSSVFPLKEGSSGSEVSALQRYLIKEFGSEALPKYGADGIWGDETSSAVDKYLKRSSISLNYFLDAQMHTY